MVNSESRNKHAAKPHLSFLVDVEIGWKTMQQWTAKLSCYEAQFTSGVILLFPPCRFDVKGSERRQLKGWRPEPQFRVEAVKVEINRVTNELIPVFAGMSIKDRILHMHLGKPLVSQPLKSVEPSFITSRTTIDLMPFS